MKPFHSKPHFQTIVEQQKLAYYRLNKDLSTRTVTEKNNFERTLQPVSIEDVELPKCPLVRLKEEDGSFKRWIVLAEVAQIPGKLVLLNMIDGMIEMNYTADELELVPPTELS